VAAFGARAADGNAGDRIHHRPVVGGNRQANVPIGHISDIADRADDGVHRMKADIICERRDLILTRTAYDQSASAQARVGVVNSLGLIGSGPVGLVRTQKVGNKYKKPTKHQQQGSGVVSKRRL
jgi:hypothetical protein